MKTAYKPDRNNLIKLIHIAKRDLALDDDMYHQALTGVTGKASCSSLDLQQLEAVLEHFKRRGWKPTPQKRKLSPTTKTKQGHDVLDKIRAVWIDMHKSGMTESGTEAALDRWVKRTTAPMNKGKGIDRVEWLRGAREWLASKTLETLKQWQKRVSDKWMSEDLRAITIECERTGQSQADVTQQLLSAQAIMWWGLFKDMGIEESHQYCTNRKKLNG
jgi:phage gp16-like protein